MIKRQRHEGSTQTADIGLTFRADVEEARMKGDRNGKAGKDEACGIKQRKADRIAATERAFDQQAQRRKRVLANPPHNEAGDEKGNDQIEQRINP